MFNTGCCTGCHAIDPEFGNIGPNLFKISKRSSEEYTHISINNPKAVIDEGYSNVEMPNYGEILDEN